MHFTTISRDLAGERQALFRTWKPEWNSSLVCNQNNLCMHSFSIVYTFCTSRIPKMWTMYQSGSAAEQITPLRFLKQQFLCFMCPWLYEHFGSSGGLALLVWAHTCLCRQLGSGLRQPWLGWWLCDTSLWSSRMSFHSGDGAQESEPKHARPLGIATAPVFHGLVRIGTYPGGPMGGKRGSPPWWEELSSHTAEGPHPERKERWRLFFF